jgi:deoxyribose-phosphate aldolase
MAAVCVNPQWVSRCAGSGIAVASVVAFPLGASVSEVKADEAARAVEDGATELDMVAALGAIRAGDWGYVERDISTVVQAVGSAAVVKVILESALWSPDQLVQACRVAEDAGAGYLKTSTGFHAAGGATASAVALMRQAVGDRLGVKASGGIRDADTACIMIAHGATRIGTSAGVALADMEAYA